ncbi:MAG TPA: serine/threonine-protein kinase, partial [Pirellulales bacterium]|nr:serine/threonine-protein kinase [Pirellulales bacterium]
VVRFPLDRSEKLAQRFRYEARLLAGLKHPLIVPLIDFFERSGRPFLVMEYAQGNSLSQSLATTGPYSAVAAAAMIEQIADAVEYVHERRSPDGRELIHRDLKPGHVIVQPDGVPRLIDFGLASYREAAGGTPSTNHHGTLEYMSPEQARAFLGQPSCVDRRADVWALGTILFELLTAQRLFGNRPNRDMFASTAEWSEAIIKYLGPRTSADDAALARSTGNPSHGSLDQIIARCVAKHPEARYQTAGELAGALRAWRTG